MACKTSCQLLADTAPLHRHRIVLHSSPTKTGLRDTSDKSPQSCRRTCQASSQCRSLQMTSHKTAARLPDTSHTQCSLVDFSAVGTGRWDNPCTHRCSRHRRSAQERTPRSSLQPICHTPALLPPDTSHNRHSQSALTSSDTCWPHTQCTMPRPRSSSTCPHHIRCTSWRLRQSPCL